MFQPHPTCPAGSSAAQPLAARLIAESWLFPVGLANAQETQVQAPCGLSNSFAGADNAAPGPERIQRRTPAKRELVERALSEGMTDPARIATSGPANMATTT